MNDPMNDPEIARLAGGKTLAPPSIVAAPAAPSFGVPHAAPAAAPARNLGGFKLPSAEEQKHLERVKEIRETVLKAVDAVDKAAGRIDSLVQALRAGTGADWASKLGLDLDLAQSLTRGLRKACDDFEQAAQAS